MARGIRWGKLIKKGSILAFWLSIPFLIILTFYLLYLTKVVSDRFNGKKWDLPSKVYSDSLVLYPELSITRQKFESKLKRLEYARSGGKKPMKGNYVISGDSIAVYLHDFDYPREHFSGFPTVVYFDDQRITKIERLDNAAEMATLQLEPEMIAEIFAKKLEERKILRLKDCPEWFPKMIVQVEDKRFYEHHGIDPKSIARAMLANLRHMRVVQGGSTITQQLVRNFFLYQRQTLWRKANEAMMAVILDLLHAKEEILEAYMNEVWMGQKGSVSIQGFGEASRFYFGKDVQYIHPMEGAMLTGMIRSAYVYSPYRDFKKSSERGKVILKVAFDAGVITKEQYEDALIDKVTLKDYQKWQNKAPYFTSFIQRQLLEIYPEELLQTGGLRIFTTLDMDMQRSAQRAIDDGLKEIERDFKKLKRDDPEGMLQASFVAVKPQTGYIKAYIGGRDWSQTQFDRITLAKRQAGSLFKPFVYMTAFEESGDSGRYTPGSILEDSELKLKYDGRLYEPKNYDDKYFGQVTFRTALEKSLNSATVRLGHEIGEKKIVEMAKRLGISSDIRPYPSIALGSFEVSPWEILQAYSVISNMGMKAYMLSIKDVIDREGKVLEKKNMQLERIVTPQNAFLVNHILEGVFERGTAIVAKAWGFEGKVAGKTGTTDDYKDSWFVGYTPELLSLAWIGFDKPETTGLTGAGGGLRVWVKFMKELPKEDYEIDFRVPENIEFEEVAVQTGLRPGKGCEAVLREAFIKGTEPKEKAECKEVIRDP